jgi:hypothetical protein
MIEVSELELRTNPSNLERGRDRRRLIIFTMPRFSTQYGQCVVCPTSLLVYLQAS